VLDWAQRADVPLLERLRYLCIVSSNLDEFFEVRAAPHLTPQAGEMQGQLHGGPSRRCPAAAHTLVDRSTRSTTTN
jgi:polyphosphate kinase